MSDSSAAEPLHLPASLPALGQGQAGDTEPVPACLPGRQALPTLPDRQAGGRQAAEPAAPPPPLDVTPAFRRGLANAPAQELIDSFRVLDCPHPFSGLLVVQHVPSDTWRLVLYADKPGGKGCDVISHGPVYHCPTCGQVLNRHAPTRNFVPGTVPVDEHVRGLYPAGQTRNG